MVNSNLFFPTPEWIQKILILHFDPQNGTPYWLEREKRLETKVLEQVKDWESFKQWVGFKDVQEQREFEKATRTMNLENFIPRSLLNYNDMNDQWIWASQTGGTTGLPKHGTWGRQYWKRILEFTDTFFDLYGIPRKQNWLFIGPTGPHTTGRLIISIAENRGGKCFTIDMDPRIVKIFGEEGMHQAYDRYIHHIWDQVEAIISHQDIGVMFCTSRLLDILPEYIDTALLNNLKGIIHAGTAMERDSYRILTENIFPGVPIYGMYGTSTTGISYQKPLEKEDEYRVVYIPSSPNIVLELVDDNGGIVPYEAEGHVNTWRLTEDSLIPGFWERDRARRVKPYGKVSDLFPWDWVVDIYSPEFKIEGKVEGVY